VNTERIPFTGSLGRILSEDLAAPYDLPIFTNSSMDGYAVLSADCRSAVPENPVVLKVIGDIPAGSRGDTRLEPGQALRIMTGAPLPPGADAVVPIEDILASDHPVGKLPSHVKISQPVKPGQYVRPAGQDIQTGRVFLQKCHRITASDIGVLAMFGLVDIPVFRVPRIAVISSGDELIDPSQPLAPGKIRDANTFMMSALVTEHGGQAVYTRIARDDYASVQDILDEAAAYNPDIILSTAGVSVGAFDYIRTVVEDHGHLDFWRVNMRPGKPVASGHYRNIPFLGLPGNPVSAFVGFLVFVRPVIRRLSGLEAEMDRDIILVRLADPIESDGRESYLRAIVEQQAGEWVGRLAGHQGSGNLLSIVNANALLIVPSGVKSLPAGSTLNAWIFRMIR